MLISVIVPVYNTKEYLAQCMDSLLDQSYQEIEVLLVDDGSTDGSAEMCDAYGEKDARIRVWHRAHSGVSASRNFALEQAWGEWISFVDSDDWLDPEMYKVLLDLYAGTKADTICCNYLHVINGECIPSGAWDILTGEEHIYEKQEALGKILDRSGTLWNKLLTAGTAKKILFDTTLQYGEDMVYLANYLAEAGTAAVTKKALYYYRETREGNVVSAGLNERDLDFFRATGMVVEILGEHSEDWTAVRRCILVLKNLLRLVPVKEAFRPNEYTDAAKKLALEVKPMEKEAYREGCSLHQYVRRMMIRLPRRFRVLSVIYAKWLYNRDQKKLFDREHQDGVSGEMSGMSTGNQSLKTKLKGGKTGNVIKAVRRVSRRIDKILLVLFSVFPIRKNMILFRSTSDFSDNARAFYDYLIGINFNEDHKLIWLLDEKDPKEFKAPKNVKFVKFSEWHPVPKRDYYCAVAKCYIFTHGPGVTRERKGQTFIHTTHSASQLKAAKESTKNEKSLKRDYSLACGEDGVKRKIIVQGMREDQFPILGMPRLDLLYRDNDAMPRLIDGYKGQRVILAMETFKQSRLLTDSTNNDDRYALSVIHSREELESFDSFLNEKGLLMLVKIHPWQDLSFLDFVTLENILFLTNQDLDDRDVQVYELVKDADLLLTDYSSVYYDYLLLDRPIGFLIDDMEQYDRGFIIDNPMEEMVGEKIYTLEDLEQFIEDTQAGIDNYTDDRKRLRDHVFVYQDGDNCKRLLDWMRENHMIS